MQKLLPIILATGFLTASALTYAAEKETVEEEACTVPGATESTPAGDFTIMGDGSTARHGRTGLEWQRCIPGRSWEDGACTGVNAYYTWEGAIEAAEAAPGWRLPTRDELLGIVETCRTDPAINREIFIDSPPYFFWTSSDEGTRTAWAVNLENGHAYWNHKSHKYLIRLVRSGE